MAELFGLGTQGAAPATGGDLIKDVSEATFMADVVDASQETPVIVDFWAPWCGPCKTLTPALEAAVTAKGGKIRLAKVNVDENQQIAAQMRVQSIPAVFAFVGGQPVDGFMGNVSPQELTEFIDRIVGMAGDAPGMAEAVEAAQQMLDEGALDDAAQTFAAILGEEPENVDALAGMLRSYLLMGDAERASQFLTTIPENLRSNPAIMAVVAEMELAAAASDTGEIAELRAAVEADPADLQARHDLGVAYAAASRHEEAIDALLEVFRRDAEWNEAAAKNQLIKIFDMLGPKDPIAQKGRRKLSSIVFS